MLLPRTMSIVAPSTAIAFQMWMPSRCIGSEIVVTFAPSRSSLWMASRTTWSTAFSEAPPADRIAPRARPHERAAAARRASRGISALVRVVHGHRVRRVAAAGEAQALADGLARDLTPRVEDPRDHGGVDVGDVALEHRR